MFLPAKSPDGLAERLSAYAPLRSVVPVPGLGYFVQSDAACPPLEETSVAEPCSAHEGLSEEQRAVFDAVVAPVGTQDILVIAGPGSGKTKTLVSSIVGAVQAGTPAEKIVAISFTNNSAAELNVRLCAASKDSALPSLHRVHVSTFHAWVAQLAAAHIEPWTYPPVGLATASLAVALHLRNPDTATHVFTKAEVAAAERHFESCETFEAMEERNFNKIGAKDSTGTNRRGFDNLVKAATALEMDMKTAQLGTFGTLMKSGTALAADLPANGLSWLFIDEAQDLNAPQAEFVDAVQKQTRCRIFAIADDDQGIYKFRGASSQFLRDFGKRPTTTTFQLTRNFRSTKPIVEACVSWITPNWTALGNPPKNFHSDRDGLPVVILTASYPDARGHHAKIILDAAKKAGLIDSFGKVAALGFSPSNLPFDLRDSTLPVHSLADRRLPDNVLDEWLRLCKATPAINCRGSMGADIGDDVPPENALEGRRPRRPPKSWHHALWLEFLAKVTADQKTTGDPLLGHPGLNDLYAALEAIRRLAPNLTPQDAAGVFEAINAGRSKDFEKFFFLGDRPEPDYVQDKINYISLHSSKGMEFPVVWVTGGGFAYAVRDFDEEQGQPNLLGELGEWAKSAKSLLTGGKPDPAKVNKLACQLENRRLLYVGMSRATDLLMISAPPGYGKSKTDDDSFKAAIIAILGRVNHKIIATDAEARAFAATITAAHRHPTWSPPHRYRVESFTSLTRQPMPGEEREVEIPREREYPLPQSTEAMIGDLFHRIMHLLCLEPATLADRLSRKITDTDLIARVSTRDPASELAPLADLLGKYFSDKKNKPWELLDGARSEVPFSVVMKPKEAEIGDDVPPGEWVPGVRGTPSPASVPRSPSPTLDTTEFLLKGFLDLVRFDPDTGNPTLILDYKTGSAPAPGSPEDLKHAKQLRIYRAALAATYSCEPSSITLQNYYAATNELRTR